jgi:hypothetical protein
MPALPIISPSPNVPGVEGAEGEPRLGHVHRRVREHRHVQAISTVGAPSSGPMSAKPP